MTTVYEAGFYRDISHAVQVLERIADALERIAHEQETNDE